MKKIISLGILITLLGGCNSVNSSNVSNNSSTGTIVSSSSNVVSSTVNSTESSSVVLEEKTIVINPSNFNKLNEFELKDVVENTQYPDEFTFNSLGVMKTNKINGLKKLEMHVYSTYENLKVYESYTGSGTALVSNKVTGNKEATYTYDLSGGNELYIVNESTTNRTHVYEIKITYMGVNFSGGNNNNNNNSSSNKESSPKVENSSYIESDWYTGNYYDNTDLTLSDNALLLELRDLITVTHTKPTKYDDLRYNTIAKADASLTDPSKVVCIYSRKEVNGAWDSGKTWNREHVWPQSTGWSKSTTAGSDLHHVRPETPSVNSSRGNKPFGSKSGHYLPVDAAKGDVARILFYMLVRYQDADNKSITVVAESMEMLLKWNELDPVDALEIQRNKETEKIQGNRNPFIDYPELANNIWN